MFDESAKTKRKSEEIVKASIKQTVGGVKQSLNAVSETHSEMTKAVSKEVGCVNGAALQQTGGFSMSFMSKLLTLSAEFRIPTLYSDGS